MLDYKDILDKHELGLYPSRGITLVKGKNAKVWDSDGNEYIDCIAGHGIANVGHCNDKVISVLNNQISELISCPGNIL